MKLIKKYLKGSLFDSRKIYNRVPAREWIPGEPSPQNQQYSRALNAYKKILNSYIFNDDLAAQRYVDKAYEIIDDRHSTPSQKDDAVAYLAHEDGKDFYLGFPQRTGLIEKSEYKPTIAKNPNLNYYRFNFMNGDYFHNTGIIPDIIFEKYYPSHGTKKTSKTVSKHYTDPTFNEFTAYLGLDKDKGEYLSIYDLWDYNSSITGGKGDNVGKYIGGKPFEIYDRIYLDDYFKVNSKPKKGDYYGGYLPEITLTPHEKMQYD